MPATRASWEPARGKTFYPALVATKTVFSGSQIVHGIIATNKGASATTLAIFENGGQVGTLGVPAGATAEFPTPSSGILFSDLSVTPAAALDVTVLTT